MICHGMSEVDTPWCTTNYSYLKLAAKPCNDPKAPIVLLESERSYDLKTIYLFIKRLSCDNGQLYLWRKNLI